MSKIFKVSIFRIPSILSQSPRRLHSEMCTSSSWHCSRHHQICSFNSVGGNELGNRQSISVRWSRRNHFGRQFPRRISSQGARLPCNCCSWAVTNEWAKVLLAMYFNFFASIENVYRKLQASFFTNVFDVFCLFSQSVFIFHLKVTRTQQNYVPSVSGHVWTWPILHLQAWPELWPCVLSCSLAANSDD